MRIFLICLSLLYVLGVSYTQRFSMGSQSCDYAESGWSFDSSQISAFSQQDDQQEWASAMDRTGAQKHAEIDHTGLTRASADPC